MLRSLRILACAIALGPLLPQARAAAIPAPAPAAGPKRVLPWIEDDWTKAVATAKARKVPLFVESWAPW
jgi:hypothetical protein